MSVSGAFWRGRRVLVTGDTGAWLTSWPSSMGSEVTGLSAGVAHPDAADLRALTRAQIEGYA